MQERNLGRSGLKVSIVGIGCNNFGGRIEQSATNAVVSAALDAGITLFDTADMYGNRGGSEVALAEALGPRRKDIVLASKFGWDMDDEGRMKGASRGYIMRAVEDSLRRLKTDWIDLYQLHKPDADTPIEETLRALDDLVRQGKVRYIGCSNLPAWQVVDALWHSRTEHLHAFASAQDHYSLVKREPEEELIPALKANGMGLLPYFPLAGGLLTGKYTAGARSNDGRLTINKGMADRLMTTRNVEIAEKLHAFASGHGKSMLELAMSWLLANPVVSSVIAGATKPEQVAANVAAVGWKLTPAELAEIDAICNATAG